MLEILAVASVLTFTAAPMASDTPPAPPSVAALARMSSPAEITAASRLQNGAPAPADLILPQLANRVDVVRHMLEHYPPALRDRYDIEMPWVWLFVDRNGRAADMRIIKPSGRPAFDSLAVSALRIARFEPAMIDGKSVDVWIPLPVQVAYEDIARKAPKHGMEGPYFTPYTIKPELLNRADVSRALVQNYPKDMRESGAGGVVLTWVYLNDAGVVEKAQVKTTSGSAELDAAALAVARVMKFSPARNRDAAVPVWIALPITFRAR